MKRKINLLYIAFLLFASCEPAIEYVEVEVEKEVIVEVDVERIVEIIVVEEIIVEKEIEIIVEKEIEVEIEKVEYIDRVEIVDNIVYSEKIVYITKEVFIMSTIEPIKKYDNYLTLEKRVFGVVDSGFEEIPLITGLFKIGDALYFYIDNVFYMQIDGVVTEREPVEIPSSDYIVFESEPFKIEKSVYKDDDISRLYKDTAVIGYMKIDSACMRGNDLLFTVCIGIEGRPMGVYVWTANSGGTLKLFESGRIW